MWRTFSGRFGLGLLLGPLASCQSLLSAALGIREPEALTDEQVRLYGAAKYPDYPLYRLTKAGFDSIRRAEYKPGWGADFRPLQFICFDRQGRVVAQWASCEAKLHSFTLAAFPPRSQYPSSPALTISTLISSTRALADAKALLDYGCYDYTYAIFIASWFDKPAQRNLRALNSYAARQAAGYQIVLVDADYYQLPQ